MPGGSDSPEERCSRPKIYVRVALVDGVERRLNAGQPYKSREQWKAEISSQVIRDIRACAGKVEIIPLEQTVFLDDRPETPREENAFQEPPEGEYHLDFILEVSGGPQSTYEAAARLGDASIDGLALGEFSFEHRDLDTAIRSCLDRLCGRGLQSLLEEYERTHFGALRDPKLWVNLLEPKYVSPEPGEREVRVSVPTRDCRNLFGQGTNVWVQRKIDRGKIDIVTYWNRADVIGDYWKAKTTADGAIDFRFTLEKGLNRDHRKWRDISSAGGKRRFGKSSPFRSKA